MKTNTRDRQMNLLNPEPVQEIREQPEMQTFTRYRLALVREEDAPYKDLTLSRPAAVAKFLNKQLKDRPQEAMCAVCLDTRNRLIGWQIAYLGTLNRAAVEPRAIFQMALFTNATGAIIAQYVTRHRMRVMWPNRLCSAIVVGGGSTGLAGTCTVSRVT